MHKSFIINSSPWDYANLVKSAAKYGGPQKFEEAIYNAGQAAAILSVVTVGFVVLTNVLKWESSKRKTKIRESFS